MRYPVAETAEKHARIIEQASLLFRERGYSVSVSEIMRATGLTHGPFYNHFASKDALIEATISLSGEESLRRIESVPPDAAGKAAYVAMFLSQDQRDKPSTGTPVTSLIHDTAPGSPPRSVFTAYLRKNLDMLASRFPWSSKRHARRDSILAFCAIAGALTLSRAVTDEELSQEILDQTLAALR